MAASFAQLTRLTRLSRFPADGRSFLAAAPAAAGHSYGVGIGVGATGAIRTTSSVIRRRRKKLYQAMAEPDITYSKIKRLREKATIPSMSSIRVVSEEKLGRAMTMEDRRAIWYDHRYKKYAPEFLGQVKPHMKFWTAALEENQLPLARLPEVAICGRSNTGKSTLVNYLCGRNSANVWRKPGCTTELVFWKIGKPARLCLVDLPGFGFALASQEARMQWTEFTLWYLRSRKNLKLVLLSVAARDCLRPADLEMISFLERHRVKWRVVVTKCDKILAKSLVKKLTILEEDLRKYEHMTGPPIPVAALKRRGMDRLRKVLDEVKVGKEVISEGMQIRMYDLLEMRRKRKADKRRRKRERDLEAKRAKELEDSLIKENAGVPLEGFDDMAASSKAGKDAEDDEPNLHDELDDTPARGKSDGTSAQDGEMQARVAKAHYALDDRDSSRVSSFVTGLFPDLPQMVARSYEGMEGTPRTPFPEILAAPHSPPAFPSFDDLDSSSSRERSQAPDGLNGILRDLGDDDDVSDSTDDSEGEFSEFSSDDEVDEPQGRQPSLAKVTTFDPLPAYARGIRRAEERSAQTAFGASSAFPDLTSATAKQPDSQVRLREGWDGGGRIPEKFDRVLEHDDFVSEEEYRTGFRPKAPEPPSRQEPGQMLSQARQRYEREWNMELENVERAKLESGAALGDATISKKKKKKRAKKQELTEEEKEYMRPVFIGRQGAVKLRKGYSQSKTIGRAPAKVLKEVRTIDAAKAFGFRNKPPSRKRNLGDGLTYEEARDKWMNWQDRVGKRHVERVFEAASPEQEDVDEAYFEERRTLRKKSMRMRGQPKPFSPPPSESPKDRGPESAAE
eukprot:TRINITY_DN33931_c0_g3_i1.p1 TRINITY_DN33931_c0_g3~~TRINITY_DN33931_c0_g3_i1.p1  ORF type:complete len:848 (+),score=226.49 TRINITY_DN33931_c0_g3_i1:111-2654(+)